MRWRLNRTTRYYINNMLVKLKYKMLIEFVVILTIELILI